MQDTARFIENWISVLVEEAEENGLREVARLLKLASEEARQLVSLLDEDPEGEGTNLRLH